MTNTKTAALLDDSTCAVRRARNGERVALSVLGVGPSMTLTGRSSGGPKARRAKASSLQAAAAKDYVKAVVALLRAFA